MIAGISGLQLILLLSVLRDDATDNLLESRPNSWRLLLDLFHFMTLEGRSSAEFLSAGDSPLFIRRASERKDAKPLNDDGVSEIALNLSMSMSDSRPFSGSSTIVRMTGVVEMALSASS